MAVGGFVTPVKNKLTLPTASFGGVPVASSGGGVTASGTPTSTQVQPTSTQVAPTAAGPSASPAAVQQLFAAASGTGAAGAAAPRAATIVPPAPPTTNFAAADPNLQGLVDAFKKRLGEMQNQPGLDPTYTNRAIASARGDIADSAAGAQEGAAAQLAASGRSGGGGEIQARSRIAEAAQRAGNKAAADISLARVRDEENNKLQRDQMENSFLLGGAGIAAAPANLALAQQGLNLQQQQVTGAQHLGEEQAQLGRDQFTAGRDDSRLSNLMGLMKLFPSYGYAGY